MSVFTTGLTLETFLRERLLDAATEVDNLDNRGIAPGCVDELTDTMCGSYAVERLEVLRNDMTRLPTSPLRVGQIDSTGKVALQQELIATYRLPYTGLQEIWNRHPIGQLMTGSPNPMGAFDVGGPDHLLMRFRVTGMEPRDVQNLLEQQLGWLDTKVGWANSQVDEFNEKLQTTVRKALDHRLELIAQGQALDEASDIPLYRVPTQEQVPIPLERKRIRPDPTPHIAGSDASDPVMAQEIYADVVQTIEQMTRAMELTPITAAKLGEEEIRNLILFVLNANYRGAVAGEVFNGEGKTDILLRWNGANAFIGECKFWKGPKAFRDAIDQLHRYVTWRDTKAALIVFMRDGNPTESMEKAREELRNHPTFVEELPAETETCSHFVLHSTSDPNKLISVALVGVVVPISGNAKP